MKKLSKKKVKERRKVGIAKAYMSRAAAIKKIQVPLSDFRRLCILKGVYPVEPKNKSKLSGANTRRKTYFFTRDIQMLMQEPILYKFWEFKVFMKRLTRAQGRHDLDKFQRTLDNKPYYKLDDIVKERYPRFVDALRDCDDALSMCFLFAMFPKGRGRPDDLIDLSRRLTIEFMHYIINSKSLRKVFISIKGYYYQAEIMGQTITWIVPHQFVIDRVSNVDINVMKTFTEFYVTILGFINYRLYKSINAAYPPQVVTDNMNELRGLLDRAQSGQKKQQKKRKSLDPNEDDATQDSRDELIAALNKKIRILTNKSVSNADSADQQPDTFDEFDEDGNKNAPDGKQKGEMTVQEVILLERLFDGLKFFLNREVPRESLTFIIRSFGGEVSWDKNLFAGSTFDESDPTITHQIVDRPTIAERRLDRVYLQPQWVYDSINMRMLLPTNDYLIGATLPPHLSPFVNEKRGDYVPPDKIKMMNLRKQYEAELESEQRIKRGEGGVESDLETDNDLEKASNVSSDNEDSATESGKATKKFKAAADNDKNDIDSFDSKRSRLRVEKNRRRRERDSNKSTSRSKMAVKSGKLSIEDKEEVKKKEDAEYRKMGIMMIPKKKKRLFDKITRTQKQKKQKAAKMRAKRKIVEHVKAKGQKAHR